MWILAVACTGGDPDDTATEGTDPTDPPTASASVRITVDGETYGLEPIGGANYAVGEGDIVWFTALGQEGLLALGATFYLQTAAPLAEGEYPLGGWGALPEASLLSFIVEDGATGGNTSWSVTEDEVSDGAIVVESYDEVAGLVTFSWSGSFARWTQEAGQAQVEDGTSFLEGHAEGIPFTP